jgi:hypothetical protein
MAIVVSATNEGPVVNVAAWFGTTVMVLGVCSRIWSKYSVLQRWTVDDTLIIVTMVSALLEVGFLEDIVLTILTKDFGLYGDRYYFDDSYKRSGLPTIIFE